MHGIGRLVCLLVVIASSSCKEGVQPIPSDGALFDILACRGSLHAPNGEIFHVRISDSSVVAQATDRIGKGTGLIIVGHADAGDGGFNQPWRWHLNPASIGFAQITVEVCDGCPSFVSAGQDYCPWSTEVLRRVE